MCCPDKDTKKFRGKDPHLRNMHTVSESNLHFDPGNEKDGYQISREFVEEMVEGFREQQRLHRRFAFIIIKEVILLPRQCSHEPQIPNTAISHLAN